MQKILWLILLTVFITNKILLGSTTGKVTGIITDSENNEPLIGVNIFLEGTTLGAATDMDGFFVILNIPPSTYSLNVEYIGYVDHQVKNVVVKIDLTTRIDLQLKSEILEIETVVVEAERPIITRDISNSQLNIEAETIETMPIQTVNEVLTLQAGIESGSRGIIVRGGGAEQTVYMVDGLEQRDERSNYPYSAISLSSVENIQVQPGGFGAEYGQARSAVVNVITKEGGRKKYSGTISFQYTPAAQKHFGPSLYDPYSYFNRSYIDPAVCWNGTYSENYTDANNNGTWDTGELFVDHNHDGFYTESPWDKNLQKQYPDFRGWRAVSYESLQDNDPTNDLTPIAAKKLYEFQHRRQGDIDEPDYIIDAGFGGPVPFVSKDLGDLRFYITHFNLKEMFVFPLSRDNFRENHTQLKLTAEINPSMKIMFTALYGEVHSVSTYDWKVAPTGYVLRGVSTVADWANSSSIVYMPGYFSPSSQYRNKLGLKLTHALSPTTFYEASIFQQHNKYNTYKLADRDTSRKYIFGNSYYVDEAPYGYWGYGDSEVVTTAIDGMNMGPWMNLGRDKSINSTTTFKFNLTTQFNKSNQIKTGFKFVYNDFNINTGTESPAMGTWSRSLIYRVFPYRLGMYLSDKLEIEDFIANLGFRLDYSDANTLNYILSDWDNYYKAGKGDLIEDEVSTEKSKSSLTLSPRLGISHPITEDSKLFFNYGHYFSEAQSTYRFRLQRYYDGSVSYIGDPNLEQEKTVSYELGYEHNLFNQLLFKVAGYYKNVSNQIGWVYYHSLDGKAKYSKASNNNYEDIRGVELTLSKQYGGWVTGFINYTYHVSTSGYFGLEENWGDPNQQRIYLEDNPYQERPHPRPYARANINFHTPEDFGPTWIGIKPFINWNLNIIAAWKTGRYQTYNPNSLPGVVDDTQWKDWYNIDLRLAKLFRISNLVELQFYIDVSNIFNFKHLNYAGFSDRYDWDDYRQSLNFSWEKGDQHGDDRIGDYRPNGVDFDPLEANPNNDSEISARNDQRKKNKSYIDMPNIKALTFLNPRQIILGIKINF